MALSLTLFILGTVGTIAFIGTRLIEERRGARFFDAARLKLDKGAAKMYRVMVFGEIPRGYRKTLFSFINTFLHKAVRALVLGLRALERPLVRLSHRMRVSAREPKGEPSAFLKTIRPSEGDGKKPEDSV